MPGEFMVQRNRVPNSSPTEEYGLISRQLPAAWALKIKEEERRRDRTKVLVKVTNVPDITAATLGAALAQEEIATRSIKMAEGGFLVAAKNEAAQVALLAMNGRTIGGKSIKAVRASHKMTGEEMFAWIEEKLKVHEEARELSRVSTGQASYGFDPPQPRVNQVEGGCGNYSYAFMPPGAVEPAVMVAATAGTGGAAPTPNTPTPKVLVEPVAEAWAPGPPGKGWVSEPSGKGWGALKPHPDAWTGKGERGEQWSRYDGQTEVGNAKATGNLTMGKGRVDVGQHDAPGVERQV